MLSHPSRHDHFPRQDVRRQIAMRQMAAAQDAAWQAADTAPGGLVAAMAAVQHDRPCRIIAALRPWIADDRWLAGRLDQALNLVRDEAFILPPLRLFHGKGLGGLVLAECGRISLSLMLRPFADAVSGASVAQDRVIFTPGHGWTRFIRAGGAHIRRYEVAVHAEEATGGFTAACAAPCRFMGEYALGDGETLLIDQAHQAFNIVGGTGDVLMLQLNIASPSIMPLREYDGRSGALLRAASSLRANSFRQMGFSVLRHLGRRDAAHLFASELGNPDFSLRWQIMREWIALDTLTALSHLRKMATEDSHPEVRRAAAAALDLVENRLGSRPEAEAEAEAEEAPCP